MPIVINNSVLLTKRLPFLIMYNGYIYKYLFGANKMRKILK